MLYTIPESVHPLPIFRQNLDEIARKCPKSFKKKEKYSDLFHYILHNDNYDRNAWNWKNKDRVVQTEQFSFLMRVRDSKLPTSVKLAIGSWYLSLILNENH